MNLRLLIFISTLWISPKANASLYSYPEDKKPELSLKQACEIAESLILKLGYGQSFFADSASVLGDEEQSGAGTWNLLFRNVKGDKIQFGIYFPQDRCFVAFAPKEGHNTEKEVTRDGKISKQWIEWKEKLRKDEEEAENVFGPVAPLKKEEQETEQDGAGQPATRSESDSEDDDKSQPEAEGRCP